MKIRITTPSRLHFGIIDVNGKLGRLYGSIGVGIQWPNVVLEASESRSIEYIGKDLDIVAEASKMFTEYYKIDDSFRINVIKSIPRHIGLGSGTQIKLATVTALARLFKKNVSNQEIAKLTGRGVVSGIGITIFESGCFVVDGGISLSEENKSLPPVIFRTPFPKDWFFVIAVPNIVNTISGKLETRVFKNLRPSNSQLVEKMSRVVLLKMLPALVEEDLLKFGEALTEIQVMTGNSFRNIQGGIFADNKIEEIFNFMISNGAYGAGQSSWGPSLYGLINGRNNASKLLNKVQRFLDEKFGGYAFYTAANNTGSKIDFIEK